MIKDGVHEIIDDSIILRLLVSRSFDYNIVKDDLLYHLEWRKSRVPISLLTEKLMFAGLGPNQLKPPPSPGPACAQHF